MKVKWTALVWWLVIGLIVTAVVFWRSQPDPKPVLAEKPFVCTSSQYEAGECEPCTDAYPHCAVCLHDCAPAVVPAPVSVEVPTPAPVETKPQPVIPPVIIRPQPVKKHAPKSRVKHLSCSQVPSIAYNFSLDQVISTAKGRGLTQSQLADLKACWEKHHG